MKMKSLMAFLAMVSQAIVFGQQPTMTLIEMTTSTQCHFCPRGNLYIDSLANLHPDKVVLVRYQSPFSGYDPILFQDSAEINQRIRFIFGNPPHFGLPGAYANGVYFPSDPYLLTSETIDSIYQETSYFHPEIQHQFSADYDSVQVTMTITSDSIQAFSAGALKAFLILIEDSVSFASPPGSNGEKNFFHECRKFVPDTGGIALPDAWTAGMTETFSYHIAIPSYIYDLNNLSFAGFIQNIQTKNIYQSAKDLQTKLPVYAGIDHIKSLDFPPYLCETVLSGSQVVVKNMGTSPLISFNLLYHRDSQTPDTIHYTGSIPPDSSVSINLPDIDLGGDGQHTVTVKVIRPNGLHIAESSASSYTNTIEVNMTAILPPLHEFFHSPSFPYQGWFVNNPGKDGNTWKWISYASQPTGYMVPALQLRARSMPEGTVNEFYLPELDVSGLASMTLRFDAAHIRTDDAGDTLSVMVSSDCGLSWYSVYSKNSYEIAFTSVGQFEFIGWLPDTTDAISWKPQEIDLTPYAGSQRLMVRFHYIHEGANDIYIRNIYLGPHVAIPEKNLSRISCFPNPTAGQVTVTTAPGNGILELTVADITGKNILGLNKEQERPSRVNIDLSDQLPGVYFVTVESERGVDTRKVVLVR